MASQVDICNMALSSFGKATISSIEERSEAAAQCKLHYDTVRRDLLSGTHAWLFAMPPDASLAQNAINNQSNKWAYSYTLPTRLKVFGIHDGSGIDDLLVGTPAAYDIREDNLYCGISPCYAVMTVDVTLPEKYPPAFVAAYWSALAARIVFPLTKDRALRGDALQLAETMRSAGEASDANNLRHFSSRYSPSIAARRW